MRSDRSQLCSILPAGALLLVLSAPGQGQGLGSVALRMAPDLDRTHELMVGDPAPPLGIEKWIKGDPVKTPVPGEVVVVGFWTTWCTGCIADFPEVSELSDRYADKNVSFVEVSYLDSMGANTLDKVEAMTAERGSEMRFAVGWDDDNDCVESWMKASGQRGIPMHFVVDREGRVALIGNVTSHTKELDEIVAGTYDIDEAAARWRVRQHAALQFGKFTELIESGDEEAAYSFASSALDGPLGTSPGLLAEVAYMIASSDVERTNRDLDLAHRAVTLADSLNPKRDDTWVLSVMSTVREARGEWREAIALREHTLKLANDTMRPIYVRKLQELRERWHEAQTGRPSVSNIEPNSGADP